MLATTAAADGDPRLEQSRAAATQLQRDLGQRLMQAMSEGGPIAAIEVCSEQAPAIAHAISSRYQARVGRTALRVRNPANAASQEQRQILEQMTQALAADPSNPPEHFEAGVDGSAVYMHAIPTQPQCLACHGEQLAPELRSVLAEWYPEDQATGFAVGELRGAFIVEWPAPESAP